MRWAFSFFLLSFLSCALCGCGATTNLNSHVALGKEIELHRVAVFMILASAMPEEYVAELKQATAIGFQSHGVVTRVITFQQQDLLNINMDREEYANRLTEEASEILPSHMLIITQTGLSFGGQDVYDFAFDYTLLETTTDKVVWTATSRTKKDSATTPRTALVESFVDKLLTSLMLDGLLDPSGPIEPSPAELDSLRRE